MVAPTHDGRLPRGRVRLRWAWFGAAVVVQLVALYWPRPVEPGTALPIDKVVHALIFGAVLWTGVRAGLPARPLAAVLVGHAVASEVAQATLLDRDGNVADALADLAGLVVAWVALPTRPAAPAADRR
jgi:VanZ family protein